MHEGAGGRPPFWLLAIFPGMHGLERNPLYLRLSGRGYAPGFPRRLWWMPAELRAPVGDIPLMSRTGFLPFFLIIVVPVLILIPSTLADLLAIFLRGIAWNDAPALAINASLLRIFYLSVGWGALLLFARLAAGRICFRLRNFFRRAARDSWGDELAMTKLNSADYNTGVFAALFERETRTNLLCVALAFALGLLARHRVPGFAETLDAAGSPNPVFWIGLALAGWLELNALTAADLADFLKDPLIYVRPRNVAPEEGLWNRIAFEIGVRYSVWADQAGRNARMIARTHWAGFAALFAWLFGGAFLPMEKTWVMPLFFMCGALLFAWFNVRSALDVVRRRLRAFEQSPGRLLKQAMRSR